jgi:hypothetical protein
MRNILSKVFVGVAITTIAAFGADNSIGTWKLNEGRSKYNPRTLVAQSHTSVREASNRGVTVRDTDNGTPTNSTYTAKYDGKKYPVTNAPWDTVAIKQVDENRFISKATKAGGKYYSRIITPEIVRPIPAGRPVRSPRYPTPPTRLLDSPLPSSSPAVPFPGLSPSPERRA